MSNLEMKIFIFFLLPTSFENLFFNRWVILLSNKILSKNIFKMPPLDEKWPKIFILGIILG